jgi:hypothetical protein
MQSNNRPVSASLRMYKPELPRIFTKADDDDLPEYWIPPEKRKRRLLKFSHINGAKVSENLFHSYSDPSTGQNFFLYAVNKVMEAPVTELKIPSAPTDDINVDILVANIGAHHTEPLEDITVQSQLPEEILREIFPEVSSSKLSKRVCSTLSGNKIDFDIHIADNSLMRFTLKSRKSTPDNLLHPNMPAHENGTKILNESNEEDKASVVKTKKSSSPSPPSKKKSKSGKNKKKKTIR